MCGGDKGAMKLNHVLMVGLASLGVSALAGLGALSHYGPTQQRLADQSQPSLTGVDPITTAGIAPEPVEDPQLERLKSAVAALADGRVDEARSIRHSSSAST